MELIINDVKLEGDLMDADFMEKFEQSMIKMRDTAQAKKRENFPTAAANYRAQCEVVNVCFDEIFGSGTADRLFHGKMNVMEHLKAIEKVSETLGNDGRIIVRPSGTEPLLRVMVEGRDEAQIEEQAESVAKVIREELC